ncbi:MAG: hypothetical protein WC967_01185 [Balneolaceae bacterium]
MRIDNKYFPAFMAVMALVSALIIVYASLSFKDKEQTRFLNSISTNDTLTVKKMRYVHKDDSVSVSEFKGKNVVLLFFSSWSEKSNFMIDEIATLTDQNSSIHVIGALVKDATDSIDFEALPKNFTYVDGVSLYNDLKVPGVPSYVVFDKNGSYVYAHVGYQEGAGYSLLKQYIDD